MKIESLLNYLKGDNLALFRAVRERLPYGYIAGGAARQIFFNEKLGSTDIDIYCSNDDEFFNLASSLITYVRVQTSHTLKFEMFNTTIQIVKSIHAPITEIFDTFDLSCCMFACDDQYMYFTDQAVEDATNKNIRFVNNQDDLDNKVARMGKYLKKGYKPADQFSEETFKEFILWLMDDIKILRGPAFTPTKQWYDECFDLYFRESSYGFILKRIDIRPLVNLIEF